ncbi:MAG: glycosyltransferase family protein [Candidatus Nitrospinota bacterium M3_3B_026]
MKDPGKIYAENLEALRKHHEEVASLLVSAPADGPGTARVETAKRDALVLRAEAPGGKVISFNSAYGPEREAERIVASWGDIGAEERVVILGMGLGSLPAAAAKAMAPGQKLIVVEPSAEIFRLAMENAVIAPLFRRRDAFFIVGPSFMERLKELVGPKDHKTFYYLNPPYRTVFPKIMEAVEYLEKISMPKLKEAMRRPRFASKPYRAILLEGGFFIEREIRAALGNAGTRVKTIPAKIRGEGETGFLGQLAGAAAGFRPDFLLSINLIGFDLGGVLADFFTYHRIPHAAWFVDNPLPLLGGGSWNASPFGLYLVWDGAYIEPLRRLGFENVFHLPYAADTTVFHPTAGLAEKKFGVSFVGNSMEKILNHRLAEIEKHEELLGIYEKLTSAPPPSAPARLGQIVARETAGGGYTGGELASLEAAIASRWSQKRRVEALSALERFSPHVFGDEGWEKFLGPSFTLHPPVSYGKGLAEVYRATKVNLNVSNAQLLRSVNQRVFDVPACGSFLLTDGPEAVSEILTPGGSVETYRDMDELAAKAAFYLENGQERERIAKNGADVISSRHTYAHRALELLRLLRETFGMEKSSP